MSALSAFHRLPPVVGRQANQGNIDSWIDSQVDRHSTDMSTEPRPTPFIRHKIRIFPILLPVGCYNSTKAKMMIFNSRVLFWYLLTIVRYNFSQLRIKYFLVTWDGHQGIFQWEALDPGRFVLLSFPTSRENCQLCSFHFTIPLAVRGPILWGEANDMCIYLFHCVNARIWKPKGHIKLRLISRKSSF